MLVALSILRISGIHKLDNQNDGKPTSTNARDSLSQEKPVSAIASLRFFHLNRWKLISLFVVLAGCD
jgi:hypothetical protein